MFPESDEGQLDETHRAFSPGTVISHYTIIEKIGAGGMGVIYKAEDTKLKRHVALKFLPPYLTQEADAKKRFVHEAQAASALDHANICTIHEIDETEDGQMFIAMACYEGQTLKQRMEEKHVTLEEAMDVAIQIAQGLREAHRKHIVHRDIKPANIMMTASRQVKIMDFGLAKLRGLTRLTKAGTTLGTLQYMSPEQVQGKELDRRSDIFSLGVVLYEMIAGQLPFKGEYEQAIVYSILNENPEPLSRYRTGLPDELQRIVEKALAKDKEERYQDVADLLADLKRQKRISQSSESARITHEASGLRPRKRLVRIVAFIALISTIVIIYSVLRPFRVDTGPKKEAIARDNSLAIMHFENVADPADRDRLGQMITSLLITDLSESEYMYVVSRQRLYDVLRFLGKEDLKVIDRTVASEVAAKAGVKWILTGDILQTEPNIALTSHISEAASGKVLATQRVSGETGEDLFSVVDKLSAQIKADMPLPAEANREPDKAVADITTDSPEAYRHYLEGLEYFWKMHDVEAERSFRQALEFDSTLAMAYYRLSMLPFAGQKRKTLHEKAMEYIDRVNWKEKHYVLWKDARLSYDYPRAIKELELILARYPEEKEAHLWLGWTYYGPLGDPEKAIPYFNRAMELDPLYKEPYNQLAYAHAQIGDFEESIWAINKLISLAPDDANPYDTRGGVYAWNGKLDPAIESYKKAVEIKPDLLSYLSMATLGHMYVFKREYARAETCYQRALSSPEKEARSRARAYLAFVPLYQGKFDRALRVLDDGLAGDRMEQVVTPSLWKLSMKAKIYQAKKQLDLALKVYEEYMEVVQSGYPGSLDPLDHIAYGRDYYAALLVENDEIAKAEEVARSLKQDIEEADIPHASWSYCYPMGCIELAKGNVQGAVTHLEKAVKDVQTLEVRPILLRYALAEAYLKADRLGEAVAELEKAVSRYDDSRLLNAIWAVKAYYLLGSAYEKSGWNKMAIEQYEEFLDIWKDADPGMPEIEDARRRLARLKSKT